MFKKYIKYLCVFSVLILNSAIALNEEAYAGDSIERNPTDEMYKCSSSIEIDTEKFYPGSSKIVRTNNLRRKTGSGFFAKGKKIYIKGRVFDDNCVPVSNATIQIWQADYKGVFRDDVSNPDEEDPYFAGSGETKTNNLGHFSFITVLPGKTKDNPFPYANLLAFKDKLGKIQTRVYLIDKFEVSQKKKLYKENNNNENNDVSEISKETQEITDSSISEDVSIDEIIGDMDIEANKLVDKTVDTVTTPPDAVNAFSEINLFDKHKSLIAKKTITEDNLGKKIDTFIFNITLPGEQRYKMY